MPSINFKYCILQMCSERGVSVDVSKILKDVSSQQAFWFNNGVVVRNIYEFCTELKSLNELYFRYHCNNTHDDFAEWIGGALGDYVLSEKLRRIKDQKQYIRAIEDRIKFLEREYTIQKARHAFAGSLTSWFTGGAWVKTMIVILLLILCAIVYIQYESTTKLKQLGDKISYMQQQNACYNTYFNQKIMETQSYINTSFNEPILECSKESSVIINNPDLEDKPSRVHREDITVTDNDVVISIKNVTWSVFSNTSSMIPVINHNTNAIEIKPASIQDINIGDIISYNVSNQIVIHRVQDKGHDEQGYYLITKGDNNLVVDPEKVRFEQVQGIVVALIY